MASHLLAGCCRSKPIGYQYVAMDARNRKANALKIQLIKEANAPACQQQQRLKYSPRGAAIRFSTRRYYEDKVVIRLIQFSVIWAVVAMTAGGFISQQNCCGRRLIWAVLAFVRSTATSAYQWHHLWFWRLGAYGQRAAHLARAIPVGVVLLLCNFSVTARRLKQHKRVCRTRVAISAIVWVLLTIATRFNLYFELPR